MSVSASEIPPIDVGMSGADRLQTAQGLSHLLADTYTLYLKTHSFHWNVTGPMFQTLHQLFMTMYTEQWNAIDPIAERIRALGSPAPGSYEQFAALTSIKPTPGLPKVPDTRTMIIELIEGQETIARVARRIFRTAEVACDQPTCDLLTQRMQIHEKNAWMLRSLLST